MRFQGFQTNYEQQIANLCLALARCCCWRKARHGFGFVLSYFIFALLAPKSTTERVSWNAELWMPLELIKPKCLQRRKENIKLRDYSPSILAQHEVEGRCLFRVWTACYYNFMIIKAVSLIAICKNRSHVRRLASPRPVLPRAKRTKCSSSFKDSFQAFNDIKICVCM